MTTLQKSLALLGCFAAGLCATASAQDSGALIEALVKKGILSDQEAEEIRADLVRDYSTQSSAGKLDLSSGITRLKLGGDVRARYQYDNEISNGSTQDANDRGRFRYRVRIGAVADLGPKWSTGVRIETAGGATSTNADFGDNFAKEAGDTAYVGQAYIRYVDSGILGADAVQADFGKFAHKFFTPGVNGFWIDSDINFEGLAQELVYNDVFGSRSSFALRSGQFVLHTNSNSIITSANSRTNDEAWLPSLLHVVQTEAKVGSVTVAPTVVFYGAPSGHDAENNTALLQQNDSTNYTDLATVLVPAQYDFLIGSVPSAFYATYGVNLQGEDRARRLANSATVDDNASMYNVGFKYGAAKLAGEYALTAEYRHVGNGAYSSLLLDSDFNGGRLNGEGFILSGTYNWTAAVASTITYFNSFNINETQGSQTNNNPATARHLNGIGFGSAEVLQVDLSVKF